MSSGMYIAYTGAKAAEADVEVIANNVANSSTTGFRRDQTLFDSILSGSMAFADAGSTQMDLSPGSHELTKNPLNVALDSEGWFVVQDPDGNELYTRRGDFRLNGDRELILPNGYQVLGQGGPIAVPPGTTPRFLTDGTLTTEHGPVGKLRVVDFDDPAGLRKVGASTVSAEPEAGLQEVGQARVAPGFVEGSNVNLAGEMVTLIQATRSFEAALRSLRVEDEMTQALIQTQS